MKYDEDIVESIIASIKNGEGRVSACKKAGISYQTFCRWYNDEMVHEDFIIGEFREHIKRAEEEFTEGIKQMAIMSIVRKFPENWQAAAWWLERKHKAEFGRELGNDYMGQPQITPVLVINNPAPPIEDENQLTDED